MKSFSSGKTKKKIRQLKNYYYKDMTSEDKKIATINKISGLWEIVM
ncbi:MAG: hypothetical protein LUG99_13695 [Lachnospiraceae bacterium]|nr:hypothetical protein [Lachnospiraceae bacterium]